MHNEEMKTIGILGGMGPMATVNLAEAIVRNTQAETDQDHPPMIVDSNTRIADRTAFLLGKSDKDPRGELIKSAKRLETAGAGCIIMPCNTAHAFYKDIAAATSVPVLHMTDETAKWIKTYYPDETKVGILATQGTYSAGVYKNSLEKFDLVEIRPDEAGQKEVMGLIYDGIKANNFAYDYSKYKETIQRLKEENNVKVVVLGCTELSVAQQLNPLEGIFVDPLQVIARAAIAKVNGHLAPLPALPN